MAQIKSQELTGQRIQAVNLTMLQLLTTIFMIENLVLL